MSVPAAAYTPPVDQPPPLATSNPYGGFWIRLAAHVVDGFIIGIVMMVFAFAMAFAIGLNSDSAASDLLGLVLIAGGQLYHAYFVSSAKMATPGKRLCGLYVTDLEGRRLSFGRALWRNVAALFSYLTLYIGFFMAGFTERKQALHDKIAGTLVHRQPGGSAAAAVIVVVVGGFLLVFVVGILAAIAIPAYQDYTVRAKMSGVISSMSAAKAPIVDYAAKNGTWPETWKQVESAGGIAPMSDLPAPSREFVEDVRLAPGGEIVAIVKVHGKTGQLRLTPRKVGDSVEWTCSSDPEIRKFVPASCRQ